jgi:hypothetical protein
MRWSGVENNAAGPRSIGGGYFPRAPRHRGPARFWKWTAITAVSLLLLVAPLPILLSPRMTDDVLVRLSNIGQAYGALAALFSALALGAVSFSVYYQYRQHQQVSITAWRSMQESLLRMVIDEPETFGPCVLDPGQFDDAEEMRRYLFTTLWLNYTRTGLHLDLISAEAFRDEICRNLLSSEVARKLWLRRRDLTLTEHGFLDPFYEVLDTEYHRVTRPDTSADDASVDEPA